MTPIANYPCTGCGCVCDDVTLTVEDGHVVEALNACDRGRAFLTTRTEEAVPAMIDGRAVAVEDAIDGAAKLLAGARLPLITGLDHATADAQREAVTLADYAGGCLDAGGSPERLFPDIGSVTCSLGELMNRADLIVLWGGQPLETHPRLLSRYAAKCDVVVSDAEIGDEFAALWAMRAVVRGKPIATPWADLAGRLKMAKCGVIACSGSSRTLEAVHALAADVNDFTRCYVLPLAGPGNPVGATQVMTWQTGYPAAVGLHRGYPRSFGREYSTERLLRRGECDLALVVGRHPPLPLGVTQVCVAPDLSGTPAVFIACAAFPVHTAGTVFRTDGVTLPLPAASPSSLPTDFQVLRLIGQRLRTMRARR